MQDANKKIVEWSKTLPTWQQDALRRIAERKRLSETDKAELFLLLKQEVNSPKDFKSTAIGLTQADLPTGGSKAQPRSIDGIEDVQGAALMKSGTSIDFAPAGLNVVYGGNGSGKSGFARILKRATGSRCGNTEKVLPNIFKEDYKKASPASAKIRVTSNTYGARSVLVPWEEGDKPLQELALARVFDSRAATIFLKEEDEIAFLPMNLDLLQSLGELCQEFQEGLDSEKSKMELDIERLLQAIPDVGTARTICLGIESSLTDIELEAETKWDPAVDEPELKSIEDSLSDSSKRQAQLDRTLARSQSLKSRLSKIDNVLCSEEVEDIENLLSEAAEKTKLAANFSTKSFRNKELAGTGQSAWMSLWQAAEEYSKQGAYPGKEFPVVDEPGVRCVLCQQELESDAKERLKHFREFVQDSLTKEAKAASKRLADLRTQIEQVPTNTTDDEALVGELGAEDSGLAGHLAAYLAAAESRKRALLAAFESGRLEEGNNVPSAVRNLLDSFTDQLELKIAESRKQKNPSAAKAVAEKQSALLTRKTLSEHRESVGEIRELRRKIEAVDECLKQTQTLPVTLKKNSLEKELFRKPFRDSLTTELEKLQVQHEITLGFRGARATTYQKAEFKETDHEDLSAVLSEGEYRAVALACFLAEQQQLADDTPIVFDDPVSSLDHDRRSYIVDRIVSEAKRRQVLVFTHDTAFFVDLVEESKLEDVPTQARYLERVAEGCGHVEGEDGEPWPLKKVNQRLRVVEEKYIPLAKKLAGAANSEAYEMHATFTLKRLRDTWERLVEETLFGDVVNRLRRGINTQTLEEISVDDDDWTAINAGMKRTSRWLHDLAGAAGQRQLPTPDDLKEFVGSIREAQKAIKKKREITRKRRKLPSA